jgi:hypothetical protein
MTLAAKDGRLIAESVAVRRLVESEPVTGSDLRKIRVDAYIARIRSEVGSRAGMMLIVRESRGRDSVQWSLVEPDSWPDFETAQKKRRDPAESVPRVAELYRRALADPVNELRPTAYVAEHLPCSRSSAGRLVQRARSEGLLGGALPGVAGEHDNGLEESK